jgi:hypothetical protein
MVARRPRIAAVFLLIFALCANSAIAQTPIVRSASDTLSSNGDSFTFITRGTASARIQTLDSYTGTWEVQCSVDGGTTFDTDDELNLTLDGQTSTTAQSVSDTVGVWAVNVAGCTHIKIVATAGFAASDTVVHVHAISVGGGVGSGSGSGSSFDGVLLDAAAGDPLTNTTANSLKTTLYDSSGNAIATSTGGSGTVDANTTRTVEATDSAVVTHLANLATYLQPGSTQIMRSDGSDNDDETQVKATAGVLLAISGRNNHATTHVYLRCTNLTAANTTPGTSTIFFEMMLPAGGGFVQGSFGPGGLTFGTALTCYLATGEATTDTTDPAADDVVVNVVYR